MKCSSVQFSIRISFSSICESRKLPRFRLFHTGRKRLLLIGKTATWRIENHVLVDLCVQTRSAHSLQVKSVTPHRLITDDQHIRMLLGQLRNSLARQVAAYDQSLENNLYVAEHCMVFFPLASLSAFSSHSSNALPVGLCLTSQISPMHAMYDPLLLIADPFHYSNPFQFCFPSPNLSSLPRVYHTGCDGITSQYQVKNSRLRVNTRNWATRTAY